jgi:hypothetical protein
MKTANISFVMPMKPKSEDLTSSNDPAMKSAANHGIG